MHACLVLKPKTPILESEGVCSTIREGSATNNRFLAWNFITKAQKIHEDFWSQQ